MTYRLTVLFRAFLLLCFCWPLAAAAAGLPQPVSDADYRDGGRPDAAKVELGRLLFYDKILSGNENISCASCHHPFAGGGDALSLPVGEGGEGFGAARSTGYGSEAIFERVPRNAPPLFNLGAAEFETIFHDGRLRPDPRHPSGFFSPAGDDLPVGLDSVLAAQAMFPVTSATEMAGQPGENPIADLAAAGDLPGLWQALAGRLRAVPEYVERFRRVYRHVRSAADIEYVDAANAIAAYEASVWRADDSPFDRYLRGERDALSPAAERGMALFYGEARCAQCHSGKFQTDHRFYAIGMPQLGPGKGDGHDGHEDFGRERVSLDGADRYRFRTPSLRNVALTGPWGHAGAYTSLAAVVRHHAEPQASLDRYDRSQARLSPRGDLEQTDFLVQDDRARRRQIREAIELPQIDLSGQDRRDLVEFLNALTDPASIDMHGDVPARVPSGLPVFD